MLNNNSLILFRGLPGAGKTTLANILCPDGVFSADDFFYDEEGVYNFDPLKLNSAHHNCRKNLIERIELRQENSTPFTLGVANTFCQEWEFEDFKEIAKIYNLNLFSIIVENRHGNNSLHSVPLDIFKKMKSNFHIKLD